MANNDPNVKVKQVQQFFAGGDHSVDRAPLAAKTHVILHVLFASELAGSERYCIDLANGQATLGHEVHLCCAARPPARRACQPAGRPSPLHDTVSAAHAPATADRRGRHRYCSWSSELGLQGTRDCSRHRHQGCDPCHVGFKAEQHARLDGVICANRAQLPRLDAYTGHAGLVWNWLPEVKHGRALDLRSEAECPAWN